jgi:hypothetical protein
MWVTLVSMANLYVHEHWTDHEITAEIGNYPAWDLGWTFTVGVHFHGGETCVGKVHAIPPDGVDLDALSVKRRRALNREVAWIGQQVRTMYTEGDEVDDTLLMAALVSRYRLGMHDRQLRHATIARLYRLAHQQGYRARAALWHVYGLYRQEKGAVVGPAKRVGEWIEDARNAGHLPRKPGVPVPWGYEPAEDKQGPYAGCVLHLSYSSPAAAPEVIAEHGPGALGLHRYVEGEWVLNSDFVGEDFTPVILTNVKPHYDVQAVQELIRALEAQYPGAEIIGRRRTDHIGQTAANRRAPSAAGQGPDTFLRPMR